MTKKVARHIEKKTIEEYAIVPKHAVRKESRKFERNRKILIKKFKRCFICGSRQNLQAHHYGCEWSMWNDCDRKKLKKFLKTFDVYGYSRRTMLRKIKSPDDIRNLVLLCEEHHIEKKHGIHEMTFPLWIMQKIAKKESLLFKK